MAQLSSKELRGFAETAEELAGVSVDGCRERLSNAVGAPEGIDPTDFHYGTHGATPRQDVEEILRYGEEAAEHLRQQSEEVESILRHTRTIHRFMEALAKLSPVEDDTQEPCS